jgi:ABC-type multidrug transport system ATPase subunit
MNLDYFKGLAEKSWGIPLSYLRYLDLFKMESRLDQKVSTFSQGTLQKAGLIRALFFEPQILLLDEPTSGLDPDSVQVWQKSMEVLPDNTSIVIVSHDFQKPPPQNKIWKLSKGGIQTSDIFIH